MTTLIDRLKNPELHYPGNFDTPARANAVLMSLCQEAADALAAPVQEPVGYADSRDLAKDGNWDTLIVKHASEMREGLRFNVPLYCEPIKAAAQPAVPLTDAQRRAIIAKLSEADYADGDEWDNALFDAIEAAHGIKENT